MISINLYENTLSAAPTRQVRYYGRIGEWMLDTYSRQPVNFRLQIYKGNVEECNDISNDIAKLSEYVEDEVIYNVVHTAGGTGLEIALWVVLAVTVTATVYMMANLPDIPSIPTSASRNQNSGNNNLSDRNNKLRLGSRVEDAYGENIMVPSLLMPTYYVWDTEKNKVECAYYCIGEGYYDILADDVKDGDTPINSILGAKAIIGKPFTVPTLSSESQMVIGKAPIEKVDAVKRSGVVDGVKLDAPDMQSFSNTGNKGYLFGIDVNGYFTISKDLSDGEAFSSLLDVGELVHIETSATVSEDNPLSPAQQNSWNIFVNGDYKVKNATESSFTVTNVDGSLFNPYTPIPPTILSHPTGLLRSLAKVYKKSNPNITNFTTMKRVRCPFFVEKVMVNVGSSQGMGFINNAGTYKITVAFTVEVYKETAPNTNVLLWSGASDVSGNAQGVPVGRTVSIPVNVEEGTILNIRLKRDTNFIIDSNGTTLQNITWDDLYIKSNVMTNMTKYLNTYNYTTIYTETTVNASATSVKDRELNVKARRKLPSYIPESNTFSTFFKENGMCDNETLLSSYPSVSAVLGYISKAPSIGSWYGESLNTKGPVDVSQIKTILESIKKYYTSIQSLVVAEDSLKFNYTFDDNNTTFEETISVVANAVDCAAYRQGGSIRFFPNIPQQYNTIMFSHRNKIGSSSDKITRTFNNDGEYDGIEFVYNDIDTGKAESILLPSNSISSKKKKVEIPGIRKYNQAWLRANREWNKIKYKRSQIKTEVTNEARALVVGQRVGIMDNTLFKVDSGEVLAYLKEQSTGKMFITLSEPLTQSVSDSYIYLKRRNGTAQKIKLLSSPDVHTVELALAFDEALVTEYSNDGMRTAYTIVDSTKENSSSWMVGGVDIGENSSTITAYNYTDGYWETDGQIIPNKLDVI